MHDHVFKTGILSGVVMKVLAYQYELKCAAKIVPHAQKTLKPEVSACVPALNLLIIYTLCIISFVLVE